MLLNKYSGKVAYILVIFLLIISLYIHISHEISIAKYYSASPFFNMNFTFILISIALKFIALIILLNKRYTKIA